MGNLVLHRLPRLPKDDGLKVDDINRKDFDFKGHFKGDVIAEFGRWWLCAKAKPWSLHDLMLIDSSDDFARSFSDLSSKEVQNLFDIVSSVACEFNGEEAEKLIVGANINQFDNSCDPESIQRIHIHICGFTKQEVSGMQEISKENICRLTGKDNAIFDDPIIAVFKNQPANFDLPKTNFDYGYKFDVGTDISELATEKFADFIIDLDRKTKAIYISISESDDFKFLSYAFTITKAQRVEFLFSPRSISGRGVLESMGVILCRDLEKEFSQEQYELRNKFIEKISRKFNKKKEQS